jgi:tRNA G18 (ribose-2'-O)-methylase SpoU
VGYGRLSDILGALPVIPIDDAADPRLADYRGVGEPALARQAGLFVAEGRLVVERVIASSRFTVESLLVTPAAFAALGRVVTALEPDVPIYVAPLSCFEPLTGFRLHRGCVALVRRPAATSVARIVAAARLVIALDGVSDADNVGGIFRNAAAFGADAVVLSPTTCDPLYRKAVRTSMAATLNVPFARSDRWPDDLADFRRAGFTVVALSPRADVRLDDFARAIPSAARIVLVLGAEGSGVSDGVGQAVDVAVRIPMTSAVDSLNVAVACGIALSRLPRVDLES